MAARFCTSSYDLFQDNPLIEPSARGVEDDSVTLDRVLQVVREERGLDFQRYRRTTVERRVGLRMLATNVGTYGEYLDFLRENPLEMDQLIDNLTLKVSSFFREPRSLALLGGEILDEILRAKTGLQDQRVRIWSAGCARGEEPYSIAIVLHEKGLRLQKPVDFLVCATDIDRVALRDAERGRYREESLDKAPPEVVANYFDTENGKKVIREQIRARVEFMYHDLVTNAEPPLGKDVKFDVVVCRNVFIYFQQELQEQTLALIQRALVDRGFLILGESESILPGRNTSFECVDRRASAYRKK